MTLYSFILTIELGWISTWSCTIIYFIFRSTATALFLSFGSVQNFIITFRFKNLEIWNDEFKKMKNLLFLTNWILLHADRGKFFNLYKKGANWWLYRNSIRFRGEWPSKRIWAGLRPVPRRPGYGLKFDCTHVGAFGLSLNFGKLNDNIW